MCVCVLFFSHTNSYVASQLCCFAFKKMFIMARYDASNAYNKHLNTQLAISTDLLAFYPWKGGKIEKQTSHNNYLEKVCTTMSAHTEFRPISCWFKRVYYETNGEKQHSNSCYVAAHVMISSHIASLLLPVRFCSSMCVFLCVCVFKLIWFIFSSADFPSIVLLLSNVCLLLARVMGLVSWVFLPLIVLKAHLNSLSVLNWQMT